MVPARNFRLIYRELPGTITKTGKRVPALKGYDLRPKYGNNPGSGMKKYYTR